MDIKKLNIKEILQMAIVMEEQGIKFYTHGKNFAKNQYTKDRFEELVNMEKDHKLQFANILENLNNNDILTNYIDDTVSIYIESITANPYLDEDHEIKGFMANNPIDKIFQYAIQTEKDAITFYLEIRDLLEKKESIEVVDKIIDEEKSHIVILEKLRKMLDK